MPEPAQTTSPPQPRRRWRRRALRVCVGVLIGLLLVVVGVQIFLWTEYPKRIGVSIAQELTGLRVEMGSLRIGWFGDTSITDLAVALPLEDKPFLTVPSVRVKHTSLLGILWKQNVVIRAAEIDSPRIELRQDASGVWNLQQALQQVSQPAQNVATVEPEQRGAGSIYLPDIRLQDGAVRITRSDGQSAEIGNLRVDATREGPLVWRFDARAGELARASGTVAPAGRWPHETHVEVEPALLQRLRPIVGPLADQHTLRASADWSGERTATGLTGRLLLHDGSTQAGPVRASGAATITLAGAEVQVEPDGFDLAVADAPVIELVGGRIGYTGAKVRLDELRVRFADGSVRLSGAGDIGAQTARLDASWERVAFPPLAQHQGRFTLDIANVWPGKPQVSASLDTSGELQGRSFDVQLKLVGAGERWTDGEYVIDLQRTRVSDDHGIASAIVGARVRLRNSDAVIELAGIEIPNRPGAPSADLRGAYAFAGEGKGKWWLWSSLQASADAKLDYRAYLDAFGDEESITLQNAYAGLSADVWANVTGHYRFDDPEPVNVQVDLEADPARVVDDRDARLQIKGRLGASARLTGTLQPMNLALAGHARARRFEFRRFDLGNSEVRFNGVMLPDFVNVETSRLKLLGGTGWVGLKYPYFGESLLAQLTLERLDLKQVGEVVGVAGVEGNVGGALAFNVPFQNPRALSGGGQLIVEQLALSMLQAQRVTIPIQVRDEWVQATPDATQAGGGKATVDVVTTFAEPTRLRVHASLDEWLAVLPLRDIHTRTGGTIDLSADLARQSAVGSVALDTVLGAHESKIGNASLVLGLDGRTAKLRQLTGDVLGGTVFGEGTVNIDEPERARLSLGATHLSLDRLAQLAPQIGDVKGNLSVRFHAARATQERPLGPVEARFLVESDRATYKGIEIGNTNVRAFVDRDRIVLSDDPSEPNRIAIAGGALRLWGRLSGVPINDAATLDSGKAKQQPWVFAQVRAEDLDVEQLNRIVDPDGKPVPGRLSGEITAVGNPFDYRRLNADGRFSVTKSDFANVGIFAVLYDAMRLGASAGAPVGYGDLSFRLQGGRLVVPAFSYFNRSVYATASLSLENVFAMKDSPVSGYIIGTFRPLKDLDLPFLADLDTIGDALQRNATTLALQGTLDQVEAVPTSLQAFGQDFRNMLLGQTRK